MAPSSSIPIHVSGALEGGSLLWVHRGATLVTLCLKTSFALRAGQLTPVAADPLDDTERFYRNDPSRPVRTTSDLVPRLPRAEVLHAGAVFAPAGVTMVRIALLRGGQPIVDKRVLAQAANDSPGLGPRGRASPEQRALLQGGAQPTPDARGVLVLPEDFDFAFFQSAPPDQQCDRLAGGDQLVLGNLHPQLAELIIALPSRAPAARAVLGGEQAPLALSCKRLLVDTDRERLTLLWSGELELPGLDVVPHLRLEAQAPAAAPPAASAPVGAPPAAQAPPAPYDPRNMLRKIATAGAAAGGASPAMAPPRGPAAGGTMVMDGAQRPPVAPGSAPGAAAGAGTLIVEDDQPKRAALPFSGGHAPPIARPIQPANLSATPWGGGARPVPRQAPPGIGTMAVETQLPVRRVTPPPRPLPAPPPPAPIMPVVPEVEAAPPAPPPPAPPPPPERPAIQADPWAKPEPAAAAPPPPPPPPPKQERANAAKLLYKKLK